MRVATKTKLCRFPTPTNLARIRGSTPETKKDRPQPPAKDQLEPILLQTPPLPFDHRRSAPQTLVSSIIVIRTLVSSRDGNGSPIRSLIWT